jgi:hypothetical protein
LLLFLVVRGGMMIPSRTFLYFDDVLITSLIDTVPWR